jgi:hypothetical protein
MRKRAKRQVKRRSTEAASLMAGKYRQRKKESGKRYSRAY